MMQVVPGSFRCAHCDWTSEGISPEAERAVVWGHVLTHDLTRNLAGLDKLHQRTIRVDARERFFRVLNMNMEQRTGDETL